MWWRDLANRLAHGIPLPWHTGIIWRCEECGNHLFRVMAWNEWIEGEVINRGFILKCANCGRVEANIVATVLMW
mgnify:CR=1 FL=1